MGQVIAFAQKALILNKNRDSILLVKYLTGKYFPEKISGKLTLPGGQIEFGEEPDKSLIREIKEETGVVAVPGIPFYTWMWKYQKDENEKQIVAIARLAYYKSGAITEPEEQKETKLEKARWIKLKDLNLNQVIWDEAPAIKLYLKYILNNPFK